MLGDCLIRLGQCDAEPVNRDLGIVAAEYCGLRLDKNDPYRRRYKELLDLPATAWHDTELWFWQYAARDAVATLQVAQRQNQISRVLIDPHSGQLLPDAVDRFGPLTGGLQVQGAIALEHINRTGVHIDQQQTHALRRVISVQMRRFMDKMEELGGSEIFRRTKSTQKNAEPYQLCGSGVPSRNVKLIKQRLEAVAQARDKIIAPRRNRDGLVTDAVKFWSQYQDTDPFVEAYVGFCGEAKLLQFFAKLDQPRVYPQYRPLVRSGRTACSAPNLQQLPRDGRFRELIVAPKGSWLLQIDYSVLELRSVSPDLPAKVWRERIGRLIPSGHRPPLLHRGLATRPKSVAI